MADQDDCAEPKRPSGGCLTCLALLLGLHVAAPFGISYLRERSRLAIEMQKAERREKAFTDVKNGDAMVTVMDPLLLPMLANDADCVANVNDLYFAMVEISPDDARYVAHLTNVTTIGFYDTRGADHVLEHARELPIEALYFEMARLSDDSLRSLSDFPRLTKIHLGYVPRPHEIAILESLRSGITVESPYPLEIETGCENRGEPSDYDKPK